MGFYGNITNTARTQFQFDRIYRNRAEMDQASSSDGIYAGRFVLVEYDSAMRMDTFPRIFPAKEDLPDTGITYGYTSQNHEFSTLIYLATPETPKDAVSMAPGTIVCSWKVDESAKVPATKDYVFYIVENTAQTIIIDNIRINNVASFRRIIGGQEYDYVVNFNIDKEAYNNGRGYDSTVWQKVYIPGTEYTSEKYVQIAELNTVVPTFDLTADAPTMRPVTPHFDVNSTDVYYKLHTQPQWGFRIASVDHTAFTDNGEWQYNPEEFSPYYKTTPGKSLGFKADAPDEKASDETVRWDWPIYDPESGRISYRSANTPAAIYYNRAGFSPEYSYHHINEEKKDTINVTADGFSGQKYTSHPGDWETYQADIQQMEIYLPSIGNTIAQVWDTVYGDGKDNEGLRARDIGWKYVGEEPDEALGGMTRDMSTIAGCINSIHDLMGMIIVKGRDSNYLTKEHYDKHLIYKAGLSEDIKEDTYYYIASTPQYSYIDLSSFESDYNNLKAQYPNIQEFNAEYRKYLDSKGIDKDIIYYRVKNPEATDMPFEVEAINIGAPDIVLDCINQGHKIGVVTGSPKYAWAEIKDLGENISTMLGTLVATKISLEGSDPETRDITTVQGAVNYLNDLINYFTLNLSPNEIVVVNKEGKPVSSNWTTLQKKTVNNIGGIYQYPSSTVEDQWIDLSISSEEEPLITLTHKEVENYHLEETVGNLNNDRPNSDYDGMNSSIGDTLRLFAPAVDNAGHIVGQTIETVTLPYGYKTVDTLGISANKSDAPSGVTKAVAKNTQDSLSFNPSNNWIKINIQNDSANGDIVQVGHSVNVIEKTAKAGTNLNNPSLDTITIQDITHDEAGHITSNQSHTYTLPYGYKSFKTTNSNSVNFITPNNNTTVADNTQDTLQINPGNKWIESSIINDVLTLAHSKSALATGEHKNGSQTQEPKFGQTFNIPVLTTDEAGHLVGFTTETVKVPQGSLTDSTKTGADVITQLSFAQDTGALSTTRADVGTLLLAGYTAQAGAKIASTDSINGAFGKLQGQIDAMDYEDAGKEESKFVSSVTQSDGKITVVHTYGGDLKLGTYQLPNNTSEISSADTLGQAFGKLEKGLNLEIENRGNAITAVNNNVGALQERVKAIEDAKYADQIKALETANIQLANKISALEQALTDLTARVDAAHPVTPPAV